MAEYEPFDGQQVALLSMADKTGLEEFAGGLHELDWSLVASGGTAQRIAEAGLPVTDVAEWVGGGAILGHKVVTLSREVAAGLLADPNNPEEVAEMEANNLRWIHLVACDMYPLEQAINEPGATLESVRAKTDIGGPTMLREAAKGGRIALSVAEQREATLEWLRAGRPNETDYLEELAARAEYEVTRYTLMSAQFLGGSGVAGWMGRLHTELKYGENAGREAGFYTDSRVDVDPLGFAQLEQVQGGEMSFVAATDIDRAVRTAVHIAAALEQNFDGPVQAISVGNKHGNACGAAINEDPVKAVENMIRGDERAIFGGTVIINGPITKEIAQTLLRYNLKEDDSNRMLSAVIGSEIDAEAKEVLSASKRLNVFVNDALADLGRHSLDAARQFRQVRDGMLVQDPHKFVIDFEHPEIEVSDASMTDGDKRNLALAWGVNSTSNSNTITLTQDGMLIGNGVGQQDRVGAAELALHRADTANHFVMDAVAVSDSFFPFEDGPQVLTDGSVGVIFATRGSIRDEQVRDFVAETGTLFVTLPDSLARGFSDH